MLFFASPRLLFVSDNDFLTQGHAGHQPAQQAALNWRPAAGGACEASWPQN